MLRVTTRLNPSVGGGPWFSVQYFTGTTQTEADDAVTALTTFWNSVSSELQCGGTAITGESVRLVDEASGQTIGDLTGTPGSVALTGGLQPVTLVSQARLNLLTGVFVGGTQIRGKMFIPGISETRSDSGAPSATVLANLRTAALALMNNASTVWGVYSRTHRQFETITGISTYSQFSVLRSRRD